MKLLVSRLEDLRTFVSREFYFIMSELISTHGWQHIETSDFFDGSATLRDKLLSTFGEIPESILFWEGYEQIGAMATDVYSLKCRKFVLADDLHYWTDQARLTKAVGFALCGTVLATCGYAWDSFYPEFGGAKKVVWIPHSASPDFMLPYNPDAENSILLSGAIGHYYPLRQQMRELYDQGSYSIAYHQHPGYYTGYDYENDPSVGNGYAQTINRYRAAFADSLIYRYVVAKYFEIPATGALLLADDAVSGPLRELGFVAYKHYLPVSQENLEERIQYVLDESNHAELDEIRRNGQQLVWERHKTTDRARQISQEC